MSQIKQRLAAAFTFLRGSAGTSSLGAESQNPTDFSRASEDSADEIPLVHRLAIIYLMLPVVIWLVGWFEWWFGIPAAALLAFALWRSIGPFRIAFNREAFFKYCRKALQPTTVFLSIVSFAWVVATAAGGVFDVQNGDWIKHRAIFLDLTRGSWPVSYPFWLSDLSEFFPSSVEPAPYSLRFYLGYYLVPGLLGSWFGEVALNWAVPLFTWVGVALTLLLISQGLVGFRVVAATAIFVFFGGMDIVMHVINEGWDWFHPSISWNGWPRISLGIGNLGLAYYTNLEVFYLSHMIGLKWAPQHFIAGGLYTLLIVQLRRQRRFIAISGIVIGPSVFWSPFIAVSLLPLVAVLLYENGIRPFLRWQNLLLLLPLAVLLFTYLSAGTESVRRNWLWENTALGYVARSLPATYLLEFLILAVLLVLLWPRLLREPFFLACLFTLLVLPWYSYGRVNDLVTRGMIPPLVLLSYFCIRALLESRPPEEALKWPPLRSALSVLIVLVLSFGAVGGIVNLIKANNSHDLRVHRYSQYGPDYTIALVVPWWSFNQYLTDQFPNWYVSLLRDPSTGQGPAKRELIIRSQFDVYLIDSGIVAFVQRPCTQLVHNAKFILHVFPSVDPRREHDTLDFFFNEAPGFQIEDTCVASRAIPSTGAGRILAGQYKEDGSGTMWLGSYYSPEYWGRLLEEAGEPIVRSRFDVYKIGSSLMYSKAACSGQDLEGNLTIRVFPVDVNSLAEDRRGVGFEEVAYAFSEHGGRVGESCVMAVELPGYEILRIETGQKAASGGWQWVGRARLAD